MELDELKLFLDEKADFYNNSAFVEQDPVQIPHRFSKKEDVEIAGFLTATISWGNRKSIIADAKKMMTWMDDVPHDFVMSFEGKDLDFLGEKAVHRTFSAEDFRFFLKSLQRIYRHSSLQDLFLLKENETDFSHAIERFRAAFFAAQTSHRSTKHVSSPYKNSATKRLMMFLRWMVRQDKKGVDFGIWQNISPKYLSVPLDVHTGNISRKLGLIQRKQNDWKTVAELDAVLRKFNPKDPAVYDFALFGLGVSGDF